VVTLSNLIFVPAVSKISSFVLSDPDRLRFTLFPLATAACVYVVFVSVPVTVTAPAESADTDRLDPKLIIPAVPTVVPSSLTMTPAPTPIRLVRAEPSIAGRAPVSCPAGIPVRPIPDPENDVALTMPDVPHMVTAAPTLTVFDVPSRVIPVPTLTVFDVPSIITEEDPTVKIPTTVALLATLKSVPTNKSSDVVVTPIKVEGPTTLNWLAKRVEVLVVTPIKVEGPTTLNWLAKRVEVLVVTPANVETPETLN